MLRRTLMVKLRPEHRDGVEVEKMLRSAHQALRAAYGVQNVGVQHAADDETRDEWDLIITMDYVTGIDEARSARDPIRKAFETNFLGLRAERVWSGMFRSEP